MSNARKGMSARRSDPTRTAEAKRNTLAAKAARATKRISAPLDTAALELELAR